MGEPTTLQTPQESGHMGLLEGLTIGLLVTVAFVTVPQWLRWYTFELLPKRWQLPADWEWYRDVLQMAFALLLVTGTWRRSGLRIGRIRQHWWKVLIVCGLPVAAFAIVLPFLPASPFHFHTVTPWLVSPGAQEIVFIGFLYGHFDRITPANVHRRVPVRWALVLTAAMFSLWHTPNFLWLPAGWVTFQLAYAFVAMMVYGLARQWTGSVYYGILTHMACNLAGHLIG
jgi:membrane protease YdiL (CAAX protease family)